MDEFVGHGGIYLCLSLLILCNPSFQMLPQKTLCPVMRLFVLNNHIEFSL